MAKLAIKKASTDVTVYLFIQASNVTTGAGLTGLTFETANLVASYVRPGAARAAITLATLAAADSAHSDGGFKEVDATNMPGIYRLDLPDAVCATGVNSVVVMLKGAANMAPVVLEVQLVSYDPNDGVRLGITALPNAAADAAGGLPISDAGGLDLDAQIGTDIDSILADTGTDGVLLSVGTGAKQISLSSGAVLLQATQTGVTIPTVTTLTNLPTMPNDWITAAGLKADAVGEIADGVWDEAISGHTTATTFGGKNQKVVPSETINDYKADVSALTNVTLAATQTGVTIPTVTTLTNLPAVTTDWLTAAGVKADAVTKIQSGLATTTGLSGVALSAAGVDAILDEVVVGTYTMRQLLKLFGAKLHGTAAGGNTDTITYDSLDGTTTSVIVETVDENGNRTVVLTV